VLVTFTALKKHDLKNNIFFHYIFICIKTTLIHIYTFEKNSLYINACIQEIYIHKTKIATLLQNRPQHIRSLNREKSVEKSGNTCIFTVMSKIICPSKKKKNYTFYKQRSAAVSVRANVTASL